MKIGVYFGSFNPIHVGHLLIANHVINTTEYNKVWLVVSPQNPLKQSKTLLNEYHRLHLVRLALGDDSHIQASDIEFQMSRPSYTIDTLTYLQEKYPQHEFAIIIGSDSYQNIHKWKNYRKLLEDYCLIIYKRPGFDIQIVPPNQIILQNPPLLDISSTQIRQLIRERKSVRYMIPDKVREEIEKSGYYRSPGTN